MSYIQSNLMAGEEVVAYGRVHWWVFVPGAFLLIFGIIFIAQSNAFGWFLALVGVLMLLRGWLNSIGTELAVTNKRVIAKFGFIRRNTIELLHSKIEGFAVEQGIAGRILNFGTVIVNGTGAGKTPIPSISAPLEFRKQALLAMENKAQALTPTPL